MKGIVFLEWLRSSFAGQYVYRRVSCGARISAKWVLYLTITATSLGASATSGAIGSTLSGQPPLLQHIIEQARESALSGYRPEVLAIASELKSMSYEEYRAIRYKPEHSLWRGEFDYELQFFHAGFLYQQPVKINHVDASNQVVSVEFNQRHFQYDASAQRLTHYTKKTDGYAGFRIHYPIKNTNYKDEFAVFLGASYFRLVGKNHVYGLSARGLAINTATAEGEEFPQFTEFWLVQPRNKGPLTIYARVESPSLSGVFKFEVTPGEETSVAVENWLFARENIEKLGVAPFTSMFLYGEHSASANTYDDYRPEVHDSDGLMMITSQGEYIWRSLTNPRLLQVTSQLDASPKGFGLLQRDTEFASYLDSEANYHLRPGLWVTPRKGFHQGRLELVEIPTNTETNDNIVAYWVPSQPFLQGESRHFAYTLRTVSGNLDSPLLSVIRTRQGNASIPGSQVAEPNLRRFVVDYAVPGNVAINLSELRVETSSTAGEIKQPSAFTLESEGVIRVTFLLDHSALQPADIRLSLWHQNQLISEVWNYVYHRKTSQE